MMKIVNEYRTHTCGELRECNIGEEVRVSGWVENIRDHGGILFVDLRDETGTLQVVIRDEEMIKGVSRESTVTVSGKVLQRDEETYNARLATGTIEVEANNFKVQGKAKANLPFEVATSTKTGEDVRLQYRYLDLRNKKVHENIKDYLTSSRKND